MFDHGLIMEFRAHLPFIAAHDFPLQFVALNFVDRARRLVLEAGGAPTMNLHFRSPQSVVPSLFNRAAIPRTEDTGHHPLDRVMSCPVLYALGGWFGACPLDVLSMSSCPLLSGRPNAIVPNANHFKLLQPIYGALESLLFGVSLLVLYVLSHCPVVEILTPQADIHRCPLFRYVIAPDQICQNAAQALGGQAAARTWHAYLSQQQAGVTPSVNARGRIGPGPWYNVKGQLIASSVADLHGDQQRDRNNIQGATALDVKGEETPGNQHDILTGSDSDGRAFTDGIDHTCNNWTSDGMTLPQANPNVPADRARAMLGHSNRAGGQNTSWNAAHMSQGCSKQALINTGGAGKLYCFASN
jgi:hypothetical protein